LKQDKQRRRELKRAFSKHLAEQSRRRQNLLERAIWWIATKPWVMSATGYTKAYHVATDIEDLQAIRDWFNDAADVIDQHYGKGYFGLRLEWGFVQRDGPEGKEEVKAIRVREWPGARWESLLDILAATNQTLTRKSPLPLSDEERASRKAARDKINQVVTRRCKIGHGVDRRLPETPVPFLFTGYYNYRPDPPPAPALESYGPEDWKLMSDFLFMVRIPEKHFEHQAKTKNAWWDRKGRKKVAFQNIRSRIAPFS
jgi:hypothetical protein